MFAAPEAATFLRKKLSSQQRQNVWERYRKVINKVFDHGIISPAARSLTKEHDKNGFKTGAYAWLTEDLKIQQHWLGYYITGVQWDSEDMATSNRVLLRGYSSLFEEALAGKASAQLRWVDYFYPQQQRWVTGMQAVHRMAADFARNYPQLRGDNSIGYLFSRISFTYLAFPRLAMAATLLGFFLTGGFVSPFSFGGGDRFMRAVLLFSILGAGNYFLWKKTFKGFAMHEGSSSTAVEDAIMSNDIKFDLLFSGYLARAWKANQIPFGISTPTDVNMKSKTFIGNIPSFTWNWLFLGSYAFSAYVLGGYILNSAASSIYAWPMGVMLYWLAQPSASIIRGIFGVGKEGALDHVGYARRAHDIVTSLSGVKDDESMPGNISRLVHEFDILGEQSAENKKLTENYTRRQPDMLQKGELRRIYKNIHPMFKVSRLRKAWELSRRGWNWKPIKASIKSFRLSIDQLIKVSVQREIKAPRMQRFKNALKKAGPYLKIRSKFAIDRLPSLFRRSVQRKAKVARLKPVEDKRPKSFKIYNTILLPTAHDARMRDLYVKLGGFAFRHFPNFAYNWLIPAQPSSEVKPGKTQEKRV